jgi:hypothetical protein
MSCELDSSDLLITKGKQVSAIEAAVNLLRQEAATARLLGIDIAFGPKQSEVEAARLVLDEPFPIEMEIPYEK